MKRAFDPSPPNLSNSSSLWWNITARQTDVDLRPCHFAAVVARPKLSVLAFVVKKNAGYLSIVTGEDMLNLQQNNQIKSINPPIFIYFFLFFYFFKITQPMFTLVHSVVWPLVSKTKESTTSKPWVRSDTFRMYSNPQSNLPAYLKEWQKFTCAKHLF